MNRALPRWETNLPFVLLGVESSVAEGLHLLLELVDGRVYHVGIRTSQFVEDFKKHTQHNTGPGTLLLEKPSDPIC